MKLLQRFWPIFSDDETSVQKTSTDTKLRYHRLWLFSFIITCLVSLTPLVIMTFTNYHQYEEVLTVELTYPVSQLLSNTKQSLESFIDERLSALTFLINEKSFKDLSDKQELRQTLLNLKKSYSGLIDIGLIDSKGNHRTYVGPYNLEGNNYKDQSWFHEVNLQGVYVSDVFMGYRKFPHFVMAVKKDKEDGSGSFYVIRVTMSSDILNRKIHSMDLRPKSDAFIINKEGILQTPSKFHGEILHKFPHKIPNYTKNVKVVNDNNGSEKNVTGYTFIEKSPFILMIVQKSEDMMESLFKVKKKLILFMLLSTMVIILVVFWSSTYLVKLIYRADVKQIKVLHNLEYTNKMASIGRLAAGVAHEINNPLAIINEKSGLLKDLATFKKDFVYKEKTLQIVESIHNSINRCKVITRRLLGFAKRMDINSETINIELMLKEIVGFVEQDANLRNISINFQPAENIPMIDSDKGQLQQVFINIINNALQAINECGRIDISLKTQVHNKMIDISIVDNGPGIPEENLEHLFEPFFTTKGEYGTGLGLSITYGIIEKLGGKINVESILGEGSKFTVSLPIKRT